MILNIQRKLNNDNETQMKTNPHGRDLDVEITLALYFNSDNFNKFAEALESVWKGLGRLLGGFCQGLEAFWVRLGALSFFVVAVFCCCWLLFAAFYGFSCFC